MASGNPGACGKSVIQNCGPTPMGISHQWLFCMNSSGIVCYPVIVSVELKETSMAAHHVALDLSGDRVVVGPPPAADWIRDLWVALGCPRGEEGLDFIRRAFAER